MISIAAPVFVLLAGLALYLLAAPPKPQEIGRIMFFCGLLATLLRFVGSSSARLWTVLLFLAVPLAAQAQTQPFQPTTPRTVGELVVSLLPHVIGLLFFGLITYVAPALRGWLTEKAKLNALARVALRLETLTESIVAHLNAGMRAQFEAAARDGKITAEEAKALADEALRLVKEFLGREGLLSVAGVMGLATGLIDVFLRGQIEKSVERAHVVAAQKPASNPLVGANTGEAPGAETLPFGRP